MPVLAQKMFDWALLVKLGVIETGIWSNSLEVCEVLLTNFHGDQLAS